MALPRLARARPGRSVVHREPAEPLGVQSGELLHPHFSTGGQQQISIYNLSFPLCFETDSDVHDKEGALHN